MTLWIICSGDDGLLLQQVMFGRSKSWPQSANGQRSAAFPIAYSRSPLRIVGRSLDPVLWPLAKMRLEALVALSASQVRDRILKSWGSRLILYI